MYEDINVFKIFGLWIFLTNIDSTSKFKICKESINYFLKAFWVVLGSAQRNAAFSKRFELHFIKSVCIWAARLLEQQSGLISNSFCCFSIVMVFIIEQEKNNPPCLKESIKKWVLKKWCNESPSCGGFDLWLDV